jgi:RNA polymerase sigma-70 factor (ECF subfamily)
VIFLHDEDNILMEKVKNNDKSAYETLVIKHRAKAINFAYSFISDLYESEDIVQECFAKVYINRIEYKPLNTFKTYLFTVIRNSCIDYLRKNKKIRTINLDDISEISDNIAPEDSFIQTERITKIFKHLESLPDDYKTALYLLAFDEMTYEEIAKVMQKSIAQVKVIIHRARKKLKKLCEGDDIFEN